MPALVSVVIPVFNRAHCVGRAIQSVLEQTHRDFEVIVVDNGSTDATPSVLAAFGSAIRVFRQENLGPSGGRNTGWRAARGELVAFLDSDDWWAREKLEQQVPLMDPPAVVLSATNWVVRGEGTRSSPEPMGFEGTRVFEEPLELVTQKGGHRLFLSSWMVRRSAIERVGGFDVTLPLAEDNQFIFRLAFCGQWAITNAVLVYREADVDSVNLSRPDELGYERQLTRCMLRALADARLLAFDKPSRFQRRLARMYASYLRNEAEFAALDGRKGAARRRAIEALAYRPPLRSTCVALLCLLLPALAARRTAGKYRGQ